MSTKTPILSSDVLKGDLLRKEYDSEFGLVTTAHEFYAGHDGDIGNTTEGSLFLLNRPVPPVVLPTEPGFYQTGYHEPDVFQLIENGTWWLGVHKVSDEQVRHDGGSSLTRLRPEAEVIIEVLAEVKKSILDGAFVDVSEFGKGDINIPITKNIAAIAAKFGVTILPPTIWPSNLYPPLKLSSNIKGDTK